jgi:protein-tyrosine phosphatase
MDPRIGQRLEELGLSPEGFAPRQFTSEMAIEADLILGASRDHRTQIVRTEPKALRRTFALTDFSDLASHLLRTRSNDYEWSDRRDNFVRCVAAAVAQIRDEVQPRSKKEAEIIDPYRAPSKIVDLMIEQVDGLLPSIASVFGGRRA